MTMTEWLDEFPETPEPRKVRITQRDNPAAFWCVGSYGRIVKEWDGYARVLMFLDDERGKFKPVHVTCKTDWLRA